MMIHGPMNHLAFARQGDPRWVILPSPYLFEDVIAYKGQFYAVTRCGVVLIWEPDGVTFKSRMIDALERNKGGVYFKKYLAESVDGDLVLIFRVHRSSCDDDESDGSSSDYDNDECGYPCKLRSDPTVRFQVFILREGYRRKEWKESDDLGNVVLFIGYNSAAFFSIGAVSALLPNCIYFMDGLLGNYWRPKKEPHDTGVFDMKNKVVKPMPSTIRHSKCWPPPIWITPSIYTTSIDT